MCYESGRDILEVVPLPCSPRYRIHVWPPQPPALSEAQALKEGSVTQHSLQLSGLEVNMSPHNSGTSCQGSLPSKAEVPELL